MRINRSLNTKKNSFWGMITRIVTLLCPFITRTVLIKKLGAEYLGLNSLFTSILTVLSMSELGVGSAIVYSMYKPIAEDNTDLINALLNLYKKIYKVIGAVILIAGILIIPFLSNFISGDVPDDINVTTLYILYLFNTVISYFLFSYRICLLNAFQRNDLVSKITVTLSLIMYISQICLLYLTRNYYAYIITLPIYTIFYNIGLLLVSKKYFPQFSPCGIVSKDVASEIKTNISGLMIVRIAEVSRNSLDSIIISSLLGLTTVAIYNNYYYVINAVSSLLLVLTNAMSAGIGNSIAADSKEKNYSDMKRINFLYLWLSGVAASCIASLYQPFMKIWVGMDLMFPNDVMWLFVIYFILLKLVNIQGQYLDATGLWWHRKWYALLEVIVNLTLNIGLGVIIGVKGIIIATLITSYFINFLSTAKIVFKYYYNISGKRYIAFQTIFAIIMLTTCYICYYLCLPIPTEKSFIQSILLLLLRAVISIIATCFIYWIIFHRTLLYKESKAWLLQRIK